MNPLRDFAIIQKGRAILWIQINYSYNFYNFEFDMNFLPNLNALSVKSNLNYQQILSERNKNLTTHTNILWYFEKNCSEKVEYLDNLWFNIYINQIQ
jgi:hypothetical protein